MHPEAFAYVVTAVTRFGPFKRVLDLGGRDVNGSTRSLFDGAEHVSVDLREGPGVDVVADAATYRAQPPFSFDCVVCTEVLEHTENWPAIILTAQQALTVGGILIVTCATEGRPVHSGVDGEQLRDGEHYRNIPEQDLRNVLKAVGFEIEELSIEPNHHDLRVVARKEP